MCAAAVSESTHPQHAIFRKEPSKFQRAFLEDQPTSNPFPTVKPSIVSTDDNAEEILNALRQVEGHGDTLVGGYGLFNLQIFLEREPRGVTYFVALCTDDVYLTLWEIVEQCFIAQTTKESFRREFVDQMYEKVESLNPKHSVADSVLLYREIERIKEELLPALFKQEGSYTTLRKLFTEGRFAVTRSALGAGIPVSTVGRILESQGRTVDTLYTGDAYHHLPASDKTWIDLEMRNLSSGPYHHVSSTPDAGLKLEKHG